MAKVAETATRARVNCFSAIAKVLQETLSCPFTINDVFVNRDK